MVKNHAFAFLIKYAILLGNQVDRIHGLALRVTVSLAGFLSHPEILCFCKFFNCNCVSKYLSLNEAFSMLGIRNIFRDTT